MRLFSLRSFLRGFTGWVALSLVLFSGCKTYLKPERPTAQGASKVFPREVSKMALPIEISIPHLEKEINAVLDGELYRDMSYTNNGGDDLKLRISKIFPIKLRGEGQGIHYELPLRIWVDMRKEFMGFKVSEDMSLDILVKLHSDLSLNPDWSVQSKTRATSFRFLTAPVLDLGVTQVNLTSYLNEIIQEQLSEWAPSLDEEVRDFVDLRSQVEKAWIELQQPIQLDEDYNTWLYLNPQKIHLAPVKATKNMLLIETGLETYADIRVGDPSGYQPEPMPLPQLIRRPMGGDQFALNVGVGISFEQAEKILRKEFIGYTYKEGKRQVTIIDLEIYGNGDQVVMVFGLAGSVNGEAYMVGTPYYDPETRSMKLDNFDFDVKTSKLALQVADFLVHGPFKKRLQQYTDLPLGEYIDSARVMLTESLAEDFGVPGLRFQVDLDEVAPADIFVQPAELRLQLRLTGHARVRYGL